MKLNIKTSTSGETEIVGFRLYIEDIAKLDTICSDNKLKRSVLLRHIINEYIDAQEGEV